MSDAAASQSAASQGAASESAAEPRTLGALIREETALTLPQTLRGLALVAFAALVLGGSEVLIGPKTALAGYLTILFLLTIVRVTSWRAKLLAAAWSLAVALLGFAVGGVGIWATVLAILVVSLVQGFVTAGEAALLTRSPMNVLAFATLAQGGAQPWHVVLGSVIGIAVVLGFSAVAVRSASRHPREAPASTGARWGYGISTAAGSLIIVWVSELTGFPYSGWALISFCVMLAVGFDGAAHRAVLRIVGSVLGAFLSVGIAWLPAPWPTVGALICMVLCVAYITSGKYGGFMLFLTPAILLTTASGHSPIELGLYRLEAVFGATVLALICNVVLQRVFVRPEAAAAPDRITDVPEAPPATDSPQQRL